MPSARRLEPLIALAAWSVGFYWVGRHGTWLPLAGLAVALAAIRLARDPAARALLRPGLRPLVLGLALGSVQVAVTVGLYRPAVRLVPGLRDATRELYAVLGAGGYGTAALAALIALVILAEEVAWRGSLLAEGGWLPRRPVARLVLGSALYALGHAASGSALLVLVALACGLFWGTVRLATGSLFAAAVAHVLWDAAVLLVWPLEG